MKYLFVDTETTGLPQNSNFSIAAVDNWPRLVSVAYILCEERKVIDKYYSIIKPNGFIIPSESIKVHGITTAEAVAKGNEINVVLDKIKPIIEECDFIVGHNIIFDVNVLNSEFFRYNNTLPVSLKPYYCTMKMSKDYFGFPNNKYPTLEVLYSTLNGVSITNAHNAMTDTQAAMECFWILKDIAILNSQSEKPIIKIYPTEDNISWAAEQVTIEYATNAYAFLTLVSNLLYNKEKFLESSINKTAIDLEYKEKILSVLDKKEREEWEYLLADCSCTVNYKDNPEWIKSMFNFLKEQINKKYVIVTFNKFNGNKNVVIKSTLISHLEDLKKEVGVNELIEEYEIKHIDCKKYSLCLEKDTIWGDIVVKAATVLTELLETGDGQKVQIEAEKIFISMIDFFNKIREEEGDKRNERLMQPIDHKKMEETLNIIKNYNSPDLKEPSGCMVILSLFAGIGSILCVIIALLP